MVRTIKAKFSKGVFQPLEPAVADAISGGEEVLITISTPATVLTGDPVAETPGAGSGLLTPRNSSGTSTPTALARDGRRSGYERRLPLYRRSQGLMPMKMSSRAGSMRPLPRSSWRMSRARSTGTAGL